MIFKSAYMLIMKEHIALALNGNVVTLELNGGPRYYQVTWQDHQSGWKLHVFFLWSPLKSFLNYIKEDHLKLISSSYQTNTAWCFFFYLGESELIFKHVVLTLLHQHGQSSIRKKNIMKKLKVKTYKASTNRITNQKINLATYLLRQYMTYQEFNKIPP